jgi:hypothetical protein
MKSFVAMLVGNCIGLAIGLGIYWLWLRPEPPTSVHAACPAASNVDSFRIANEPDLNLSGLAEFLRYTARFTDGNRMKNAGVIALHDAFMSAPNEPETSVQRSNRHSLYQVAMEALTLEITGRVDDVDMGLKDAGYGKPLIHGYEVTVLADPNVADGREHRYMPHGIKAMVFTLDANVRALHIGDRVTAVGRYDPAMRMMFPTGYGAVMGIQFKMDATEIRKR